MKYDIAIIGAGSGGLVAAELAIALKARVIMIEAEKSLGGECLHSGCVPSKALIHASKTMVGKPFSEIFEHIHGAIDHIQTAHDNDEFYQRLGVEVIHGRAQFTGPHELMVNDTAITAKKIVIATGSKARIPAIDGLDTVDYLTNESIFDLHDLPTSLTVIGGGPIGCELGQAFARLGTNVTIIHSGERLIDKEIPEASAALLTEYQRIGITVHFGATITRVSKSDSGSEVHFTVKDEPLTVSSQQLLVATGRQITQPDGLDTAGITASDRGITVDKHLQTSQSHIYAIGDCNGGLQFTHAAAEQASIAVSHAVLGVSGAFEPDMVPRATFTTPEVAHVGPIDSPAAVRHATVGYDQIDKAVADGNTGTVMVHSDKKGKIVSATVIGDNAAEILSQLMIIKSAGIAVWDIANLRLPYPSYAFGLKQLGFEAAKERLKRPFIVWVISLLKRFRGL